MEVNGGKSNDFYKILGLKKECTEAELKIAYRKLAMRWHPDRCSATGDSKIVDEANKKFQEVQEAYSVLSDANRRFQYDVGIQDCDDDDDDDYNRNGMADFLSEMATMMRQHKANENIETSLTELKDLFKEMFENDMKSHDPSAIAVEDPSTFKLSVQGFCLGTNNTGDTTKTSCARERRGPKQSCKHKTSQNGRNNS